MIKKEYPKRVVSTERLRITHLDSYQHYCLSTSGSRPSKANDRVSSHKNIKTRVVIVSDERDNYCVP